MSSILVLKGKRKGYIGKDDLAAAIAQGWREPSVGDKIEGLTVVPVEEKPKKEKSKEIIE